MKRFVSILLTVVLIISLLPANVAFASTGKTIAGGEVTADITEGEKTVYLPFYITGNTGFAGMKLKFDIPAGWTITKFLGSRSGSYSIFYEDVDGEMFPLLTPMTNAANGEFAASYQTDIVGDGVIYWVGYKVPTGTFNGDYEIGVTVEKINTAADTATNIGDQFEAISGKITVTGGVDSSTVTPTITTHPVSATYSYGDTAAALTVSASVTTEGALSYQWYKDGEAISGATSDSYTPELSAFGTCNYHCVVTNTYSGRAFTATSNAAEIAYEKGKIETYTVAIAAPVKGNTPQTTTDPGVVVSPASIQWKVGNDAFSGTKFLGGAIYTAYVEQTFMAGAYTYDYSDAEVIVVDPTTHEQISGAVVSNVVFEQDSDGNHTGVTFTVTFPATAARELVSIAVTTQPTKTDYIDGENFDPAGMVVTATYDDGTTEEVTDYGVPADALVEDQPTVTVTYGGKETTVAVSVEANTLEDIAVSGEFKKGYTVGDAADWTGMVVTATYKRENSKPVTGIVSGFDSSKYAEEQTITVSYTEGGVTKTATFTIKVDRITNAADNFVINMPQNAEYNGEAYTVTVEPKEGVTAGAITVYYDGKTDAPADAGTYTVTYSVATSDTHTALENVSAGTLVIAPKPVTVKVDEAQSTYCEDIPSFTATLAEGSTMAGNEQIADLGLTLTTTATQRSDVGSYDVTGTASNTNYDVTIEGAGALTIAPREVLSGWLSDGTVKVTKTYDGTTAAGNGTGVLKVDCNEGAEFLYLSLTGAGAYTDSAVGTYSVVLTLGALVDCGPFKASNYVLADGLTTYTFTGATITPADYTYTVTDAQQIKEGGGLDRLTYPAKGAGVGSETVSGTFGWYTDADCTAAAADSDLSGLAVGATKTLYWKFTSDNGNYVSEAKSGSVVVTVVAGDSQNVVFRDETVTKTYGDANFSNPIDTINGKEDHTEFGAVTYTSSNTAVATVNSTTGEVTVLKPGTATITASIARVDGVYAAGSASYTLTVNKKTLTDIDLSDITVTKVYDGTTAAGTLTGAVDFSGKVGSDDVSIVAVPGAYADKNVNAAKTITLALSLTGSAADCYQLSGTSMDFNAASITVSDNVTNTTASNQNVVVGVGSFAVPTFTGFNGEAVTGTTTYTYNSEDKSYDEIVTALKTLTKGDTASISYTFIANGNYTGTLTGTIAVTMVDIMFFVDGQTATVSNAVTIKADPTYGNAWGQIVTVNSGITASVDGTSVYGDYWLEQSGKPNAGQQTFRVLFSDGDRYQNVVVVEGTVTVAKKAAAAPTAVTGLVYNVERQTGVIFDNLTVRVQQGSTSDKQDYAGTYNTVLELIDSNNTYWADRDIDANDASAARTVEWSIAPKAVTVTPNAGQSKVYGEADSALTYTTDLTDTTLIAAFEQAVNGALSRAVGKDVGNYAIEMGSLSAGNNFALSLSGTVNFSIVKKDVTISGVTVADKVYDGNNAATADISSAVINGMVSGDNLTVSAGTAAFADKNAATDKTVTFTGFGLSGSDAGNYNLTAQPSAVTADITAKPVAVTWTNTELTFNGSEQAPTATVTAGVVDGDSVPLTVAGGQTNAGAAYTATVATTNSNYNLTGASTAFVINKASAPELIVSGARDFKYTVTGTKTVAIQGVPTNAGTASWTVGSVTDTSGVLNGTPTVQNGVISFNLKGLDTYSDGISATIPVTVVMENYADASINVVITIKDRDVPLITAEDMTVTYTGNALTADDIEGTAKFGGADVEGTWSWVSDVSIMINAGNYMAVVKFTPADSENYAEVSYPIIVVVNKVKVTVPSAVTGLAYNAADQTGVADGDHYSVTGNVAIAAGDYTAVVTLDDSTNYEWATDFDGNIQWTIAKANPTGTPAYTKINSSGKTLADAALVVGTLTPADGTLVWLDKEGNPVADPASVNVEANQKFTWQYTPADTDNYNVVTGEITPYAYIYYPPSSSTTTTTTKNEDGSTTTTVTDKKTGTVTETTENTDGSTTVVETQKDGTVTETTTKTETVKEEDGSTTVTETKVETVTNTDGSATTTTTTTTETDEKTETVEVKEETVVNEDGTTETKTTSTTTAELADGTTATTVTDEEGNTESEVTISEEAAESGSVVLPIPAVSVSGRGKSTSTVAVTNTSSKEVTVVVPTEADEAGAVVVVVNEDGTEEVVTKTAQTEEGLVVKLEGSATIKIVDNSTTFTDVRDTAWYADGVAFASSRELFNGVGNNLFDPTGEMTRGMLVTVLHRMEDEMEHDYDGTFHDVEDEHWATDGIHWAADHGIVEGYGNGYFGTHDNITREQMFTMVYRYMKWLGIDTSARDDLAGFTDSDEISSWAVEAMQWSVAVGLVEGVGNDQLDPTGHATRAQLAVFMQRVIGLMF